jgi:hypothetical protein
MNYIGIYQNSNSLISSDKLSITKACVVAIGLVEAKEKSHKPLALVGSGFLLKEKASL